MTLPYTLDQHRTAFDWPRLLKPLAKIGKSGADPSACGMHVHINRQALSALTLGKMRAFANCENMHL